MTITRPTHKPVLLTPQELGVLSVVEKLSISGVFHLTAEQLTEHIDAHPRSIQLYLRRLIAKGNLTEIEPRRHDANGYWVSAVYGLPAKDSAVGIDDNQRKIQ
ncbi:MAG: hypothetical protein WBM24_26210, partial [Candidatus Sulfotelmatobacter sp.]